MARVYQGLFDNQVEQVIRVYRREGQVMITLPGDRLVFMGENEGVTVRIRSADANRARMEIICDREESQ